VKALAGTDKAAIHDDYRRGFSVRQLAAKYGVPKSTIGRWVKQYGWTQEQKKEAKQAPVDFAMQSNPDVGHMDSGTAGQLDSREDYDFMRRVALKVVAKAEAFLDMDECLLPRDLRSVSSALLDARTLLGIQTPREAAESELRILTMRRQAEADKNGGENSVTFNIIGMSQDEITEVLG
jgi:transposase-like protein